MLLNTRFELSPTYVKNHLVYESNNKEQLS